ncbi:probable membrane protein YPO3302 [hydrothermal vent metagenome]|uniref:Probable membrane protein YPO3302 n=1 Tax=hydrothermal vent metagenome TaxID=652676 RepID=A0A1W1C1V1_9ZZZZ
MSYIIIFIISLLSATILPLSSEATLLYYLENDKNSLYLLIFAGSGNTIGSIINYLIGIKGIDWLIQSDKISKSRLEKSQDLFNKYGKYSLLLSWLPIIGDPLTLIAGALKFNFTLFIIMVAISKFGRYIIIIFGYNIIS